ncbi:proteasome regulatory particle base subunit [Clonorchis sinensis]|uniref:Dolichyl-diphosphooligosaccharide--protein glycosyltransferase subunit 2 n=1 Tax=Clonorchis sinensis TaxID=79923 RepID=A0A8T1LXU9_CLOSI|nr:proteasome regulatory particle base subunit [Clonorchis sinensis]
MRSLVFFACIFYCSSLSDGSQNQSPALSTHLSAECKSDLKSYFQRTAAGGVREPVKIYHVVLGLSTLGETLEELKDVCSVLTIPLTSPDIAFYHAYVLKKLKIPGCQISLNELKELAKKHLNANAAIEDLFFMVMTMKEAELDYDHGTVASFIEKAKTKNKSNPTAMAMIFQMAAALNLSKSSLLPYVTAAQDVLNQADEMDEKQLFFDKGMYTTALVAQGISDLITAYGGVGDLAEHKLVKLINFLLARVKSNNLRAAAHLISALRSLDKNPHIAPIVIQSGERAATAGSLHRDQPDVQLTLTNIWGDVTYSTDKLALKAGGLFAIQRSNKMRTQVGPNERGAFKRHGKSVYQLSLRGPDGALPACGHYELDVSGQWTNSAEKRTILGLTGVQLPLVVLTKPKVVGVMATLLDAAHEHHIADIKFQPGQQYTAATPDGAINIDHGQQLLVTVGLTEDSDTKTPLTAHQVFLQLTHQETKQAITFVLDEISDSKIADAKVYRIRLDPDRSADEFDNLGGIYTMELLVGDVLFDKPLLWHMANVHLHFTGPAHSDSVKRTTAAADVSRQRSPSTAGMKRASGPSSLIGTGPTKAKPGIEHMFRPADKRAPRPLAWAFTVACAVPLLGLLITWMILGFNLRNFHFGLSTFIFHGGLIAIFTLYYIYWCRLTMFTTLGYLVLLGIPTFLAGNRVLRAQVAARSTASSATGATKK